MEMLIEIGTPCAAQEVGGKAAVLCELKRIGMPVPEGFILPRSIWQRALDGCALSIPLAAVLEDTALTPEEKSARALAALQTLTLPDDVCNTLQEKLRPGICYAVRSSGTQEDLAEHSFAGQYKSFLNCEGEAAIVAAILDCYRSALSPEVLSYLHAGAIPASEIAMSVVVQEMVPAEKSGVVFTLNPITGADRELLIEVSKGLGTNVVGGHVDPQRYCVNPYSGAVLTRPEHGLLTDDELQTLCEQAHKIHGHFGFPCDIEFAFAKGTLAILQSRAVTKVLYTGIEDMWSTADFRDGGVSATVCYPLMWSLYEFIWEHSLKEFILTSHLLPEANLRKLGRMFYGRPYWNLSVVRECLSRVPGYKEREFDAEYGVQPTYEGDGQVTRITARSVLHILRVAILQSRVVKQRDAQAQTLRDTLLDRYAFYCEEQEKPRSLQQQQEMFTSLVWDDYLRSESTYFSQIFINTVHQSLFKDSILKHADTADYFSFIGGLDNISHLLPFYSAWDATRSIRADAAAWTYWQSHTAAQLVDAMQAGETQHHLDLLRTWLADYGYHSEKELDITHPNYEEVPEVAAQLFLDTLALDDEFGPQLDRTRQQENYQAALRRLTGKGSKRKIEKLKRSIEKMRKMLWWREEFRDVSTRFYVVIRQYTLQLAQQYAKAGMLRSAEDLFYLKIDELREYFDGSIDADQLQRMADEGRDYYRCYRNYTSENEIGANYHPVSAGGGGVVSGLGCNTGIITGTARVVHSLAEIGRLAQGDILITRFTDTGWTSKFALLSGVITEYGGVLCHAAIVSREYGIPCIVCAKNATQRIADGATIRMDGISGEVTLLSQP